MSTLINAVFVGTSGKSGIVSLHLSSTQGICIDAVLGDLGPVDINERSNKREE